MLAPPLPCPLDSRAKPFHPRPNLAPPRRLRFVGLAPNRPKPATNGHALAAVKPNANAPCSIAKTLATHWQSAANGFLWACCCVGENRV